MNITYDSFDEEITRRLVNTIELEKHGKFKNNKRDFFLKSTKMSNFSSLYFFVEFYVVSYFDKLFIFKYGSYGKYIQTTDFDKFVSEYAIAMILEGSKVPLKDFENLKKCYMLTKKISYLDGKIYCWYTPYYMITLTLLGESLKIFLKNINAETEINLNNINTDLKTFIVEVFKDIPEENLKMHHKLLLYYANELK